MWNRFLVYPRVAFEALYSIAWVYEGGVGNRVTKCSRKEGAVSVRSVFGKEKMRPKIDNYQQN
jgi:hypothetical protein